MVLEEFIREWENDCPTVTVRTSGSTGVPKEMAVEKARMAASAEVTCDFLGLKEGDRALLCLPVDYIAGKMMVVRSKVRGLDLVSVEPSGHPLAEVSDSERFDLCAMVPMQVYNSLQSPEETAKLKKIEHLIIGGGAIDGSLAEKLRSFPNNVWSTYGMTETLSHIALRRLNGDDASEWYTPFNGVAVWTNADGCLVIDAPKVCAEVLTTNDIAEAENKCNNTKRRLDKKASNELKVAQKESKQVLENTEQTIQQNAKNKSEIAAILTTICKFSGKSCTTYDDLQFALTIVIILVIIGTDYLQIAIILAVNTRKNKKEIEKIIKDEIIEQKTAEQEIEIRKVAHPNIENDIILSATPAHMQLTDEPPQLHKKDNSAHDSFRPFLFSGAKPKK